MKKIIKFITFRSRLEKVYQRLERIGFTLFLQGIRGPSKDFDRRARNYIKTLDKLEKIEDKAWF